MIRAGPLLIALSIAGPMAAQERDRPASDQQPAGRLRGTVVAADSGRPVARAEVTAQSPESGTPAAVGSTDVAGAFELILPAGKYLVSASRRGAYLDTQYGQTDPDQPGQVVSVAAGEETFVGIALIRAGVIAGRVFDETGDPLPNATIQALQQPSSAEGGSRPSGYASRTLGSLSIRTERAVAASDDRGEYRLFGLSPGNYLVIGLGPPNKADKRRPAAIYFPGVTKPASAQLFHVRPGQEILNADFTIRFEPTITISGIAVGPDDAPLTSGSVSLHIAGDEGITGLGPATMIKKDSTFLLTTSPGQYILRARHTQRGAPGTSPYGVDLSLAVPITVGEADITGLVLELTDGATLKGRFVFEGPVVPEPHTNFRLMVESGSVGAMLMSKVGEDWTFSMSGIESGSRRLLTSEAPGWILKGIFVNGADISDVPVEFRDGALIDNVSVVYTTVTSPLSVTVEHARAGGSATVAVFPDDPARWHARSRSIRFRNAGIEPVVLEALPAGSYLVVALADVAPSFFKAGDATLLEQLRPLAERVELVEGSRASIRIRALPFPR